MKRVGSFFLLLLFGVYLFTYKTHYCYFTGTAERYHGDCNHEAIEAAALGRLAETNLFQKRYTCLDMHRGAQFYETKIPVVKNPAPDIHAFPATIKLSSGQCEVIDWIIPEVRCRSVPVAAVPPLRAPPMV